MSLECLNKSAISKIERLRQRAHCFQEARNFFAKRSILEVDCPALSLNPSIDAHIDLIEAKGAQTYYLYSSPEYRMKELLALGIGDIYQLSHVYRDKEIGSRHQPEFTMAEWYRIGFSLDEMIRETVDFIQLFLGNKPVKLYTYKELFQMHVSLNPHQASYEELLTKTDALGFDTTYAQSLDKEDLQIYLFTEGVEPYFNPDVYTVVYDYPEGQAALAKHELNRSQEKVSRRFEIYTAGVELANGYDELTDAKELRQRLLHANAKRIQEGKPSLSLDENFIGAHEQGIPDCCGVAVGFDRILMLKVNCKTIKEVLPVI